MIAFYMIASNTILTDAIGEDVAWLREQADNEYKPNVVRANRLTVTDKMPSYAKLTVTYPGIDKPVYLVYSGSYTIFERKEDK
jgi:hypothetical protein